MSDELRGAVEACRRAEKEQSLFYRSLAAEAESRGDEALAGRFHDLHADEQHHLSRLTARLVELGHHPEDYSTVRVGRGELEGWEAVARSRENDEVARYEALLEGSELDEATRLLVQAILEVERRHAEELGGKWTMA